MDRPSNQEDYATEHFAGTQECEELDNWIDQVQDGDASEPDNTLLALANDLWRVGNHAAEASVALEQPPESELTKPSIDGYEVGDLIGRGGMGLVYRATDVKLKRQVAIKVLPENVVGSERARKRFVVEVQAAAQLEHAGIVPVYAFGEYPGGLYYTMREIAGVDLAKKLRSRTSDETEEHFGPPINLANADYRRWVAKIGRQLAEALAHSHEQLIVHRDVKPANVLIDGEGNAMLSDFGLARINEGSDLTGAGDVMGTVLYMSPEQTDGAEAVDGRTDVYSLGVTLYELLTGKTAITESGFAAAWKQINDGKILNPRTLNPAIERDLETIVLKAVAPEPAARYATAMEMAEDLGRFLNVVPIKARRATASVRIARWARRNSQWVTTLGIVASGLLAVILGLAIVSAQKSARDTERIRDQAALLLDLRGVELLDAGDARRAAKAFEDAAEMTEDSVVAQRHLRRVDAIQEWSPQLQSKVDLGGRLLARFRNGDRIISRASSQHRECVLITSDEEEKVIFKTERRLQFARMSLAEDKVVVVVGDRSNLNPEIKLYDIEREHLETIAPDVSWKVTDVWFSDSDQTVVVTGWGASVMAWDIAAKRELGLAEFPSRSETPAWVYNAKADQAREVMVAATNPGLLVAYTLPELEPLWDEPKAMGRWTVDALSISPDGKWVAAGTQANSFRLWHIASGVEIKLENNVRGEPTVARFSDDSKVLAVGDDRGGVYLWRIPNGDSAPENSTSLTRTGIVMWHEFAIVSLDFNDQNQLLVGSGNNANVWRLSDFQPQASVISIDETLYSASWSEENDIELHSGGGAGDTTWTWSLPSFNNATESTNGSVLFAGTFNGRIEVLARSETAGENFVREPLLNDDGPLKADVVTLPKSVNEYALALSDDGSLFTYISSSNDTPTIHFIDRKTLQPTREPTPLPIFMQYPRLNRDGTKWIANNFQDTIAVGDVASGEIQFTVRLGSWLADAQLIDGDQFAAISWDYRLRIWDNRGSEIAEFEQATRPELMAAVDGYIVVSAYDKLYIYEQTTGGAWIERHGDLEARERVQVLSISPQAGRVLTCGEKGTSRLWSLDGEVVAEFTSEAPIASCRFSPDSRWLATRTEAGNLHIRDASTGEMMGPTIRGSTPIAHVQWTDSGLVIAGNKEPKGYWFSTIRRPSNWPAWSE